MLGAGAIAQRLIAIQPKTVLADSFPVVSGPLFFDEKIMAIA